MKQYGVKDTITHFRSNQVTAACDLSMRIDILESNMTGSVLQNNLYF